MSSETALASVSSSPVPPCTRVVVAPVLGSLSSPQAAVTKDTAATAAQRRASERRAGSMGLLRARATDLCPPGWAANLGARGKDPAKPADLPPVRRSRMRTTMDMRMWGRAPARLVALITVLAALFAAAPAGAA